MNNHFVEGSHKIQVKLPDSNVIKSPDTLKEIKWNDITVWKAGSTIYWHSDGGTFADGTTEKSHFIEYGDTWNISHPAIPTRDLKEDGTEYKDKYFGGWYLEDLKTAPPTKKVSDGNDIHIYVKWVEYMDTVIGIAPTSGNGGYVYSSAIDKGTPTSETYYSGQDVYSHWVSNFTTGVPGTWYFHVQLKVTYDENSGGDIGFAITETFEDNSYWDYSTDNGWEFYERTNNPGYHHYELIDSGTKTFSRSIHSSTGKFPCIWGLASSDTSHQRSQAIGGYIKVYNVLFIPD